MHHSTDHMVQHGSEWVCHNTHVREAAPATDGPVCVWTKRPSGMLNCPHTEVLYFDSALEKGCPYCGKRIRVKEATK